jgi:putative membrane-bound dehydrogenase-like protein
MNIFSMVEILMKSNTSEKEITHLLMLKIFYCFGVLMVFFSCNQKEEINAPEGFSLADGFQMELIASEPLVADPVDMEIDEQGRMYVVEMHGYPLDISGTGKIKLLSDTNGDGIMDEAVVFADSLVLPTGIMRWKKGVLVTDPPHVWYFEDTNGDNKADKKEIVLTGFARSNPQHNVNSPRYGLDNWIYLGHEPAVTTVMYTDKLGDRGQEVHFPSAPNGPKLPQNAGGRSIRFQPDNQGLELLASRTQFGHAFDAWGERFLINNNNHVIHEVLPARYLGKNDLFAVANVTQSTSDHGNAAEVFPTTANPEHQLLTDVGVMTSACGITTYLGGAFPDGFDQVVFTAEPVSNLVHADFLKDDGASFTASRVYQDKEFLTSKDAWFRPVNMYIGPDGALYLLDYHRQIIEHPEWMADEVVASGALYNGTDQGRIYRISAKGRKKMNWSNQIDLENYSDEALVEKLADKNIWWRRNAQRLLIERIKENVPPALEEMARSTTSPLGRTHALWTLRGAQKLTAELVYNALSDPEAGVRKNALILAEYFPENLKEWQETLVGLKDDHEPKVRFQLLNTLTLVPSDWASVTRMAILLKDLEDEWVQVAALAGPMDKTNNLLGKFIAEFDPNRKGFSTLLNKLAVVEARQSNTQAIRKTIEKTLTSDRLEGWEVPVLEGFSSALPDQLTDQKSWKDLQEIILEKVFDHPSAPYKHALLTLIQTNGIFNQQKAKAYQTKALSMALDSALTTDDRLLAVRFLSRFDKSTPTEALKSLVRPHEPPSLQKAALKVLSDQYSSIYLDFLMETWPALTPEVRQASVETMVLNSERMTKLLDGLESGPVQPSHISWGNTVRLMNQKDPAIRDRARRLLVPDESQKNEIMQSYHAALEIKGNPGKGMQVYEKNCALCHQMTDKMGYPFGPDLASLRNRRYENILADILDPNLSIADGYDLWQVELQNGEILQGIIAAETPSAITLAFAGGINNTIPRKSIKDYRVLDVSGMTQGLEQNISVTEMADLLAFLKGEK